MLLDGAVEVMMTLAQENDEELKVMCSATLTNLSCYEEAHEILKEKGVIEVRGWWVPLQELLVLAVRATPGG